MREWGIDRRLPVIPSLLNLMVSNNVDWVSTIIARNINMFAYQRMRKIVVCMHIAVSAAVAQINIVSMCSSLKKKTR